MKLKLETKVDLQETERNNIKSYHLGAYVTKVTFEELSIDNPTSEQMAKITEIAAKKWIHIDVKGNDILNEVNFVGSLPSDVQPNIAICYNNKFRVDNHPNKDIIAEKMSAARELIGKTLEFTFTADHLQFLIPTEANSEIIENLSICNAMASQSISIEQVPLTSFNKGSNLISLKLDAVQEQMLLGLAAQVTGSEETAKPTNSMNKVIPFSFTLAKMSNLVALVEEKLQSTSINTVNY
jgi:hypothetical protein